MIRGPTPAPDRPLRPQIPTIKARSGRKTAIGAVKHTILVAIYDMLKAGELCKPPTPNPSAKRKTTPRRNQTTDPKLGHTVTPGTSTAPNPVATRA
jgi:hypothetical protein